MGTRPQTDNLVEFEMTLYKGPSATGEPAEETGSMEQALLVLLGFVAGTLGSLLGLGGGFVVVPALILLKGMDPRLATGTAVAVIVPTMLITLWRRGIQGHVDLPLAALIAVGAVGGAFLGSWLAGHVPGDVIRRTFAVVLLGLAVLLFFTEGKKAPATGTSPAPVERASG